MFFSKGFFVKFAVGLGTGIVCQWAYARYKEMCKISKELDEGCQTDLIEVSIYMRIMICLFKANYDLFI